MISELDDATISARLLGVLRARTAAAALDYAVPLTRIAGGFDTRTFTFALRGAPDGLAGPLVLRLHRPDADPGRSRLEGAVHAAVAAAGYPCPPALLVGGVDEGLGGGFLVMPRVPGRVMLDALLGPRLIWMPDMLARLHLGLHVLDPAPVRRTAAAAGFDPARLSVSDDLANAAREVDRARLDGLHAALEWLVARCPPSPRDPVVCHGDFHPFNILVADGRPSGVIDWANVRLAEPAYDVGATIALLSQGPLEVPSGLGAAAAVGRRLLVAAYRHTYLRGRLLEPDRLRYFEALRTFGFLLEAQLHRQAAAGVIPARSKPTAFAGAEVRRGALRRFHALTGVLPRDG